MRNIFKKIKASLLSVLAILACGSLLSTANATKQDSSNLIKRTRFCFCGKELCENLSSLADAIKDPDKMITFIRENKLIKFREDSGEFYLYSKSCLEDIERMEKIWLDYKRAGNIRRFTLTSIKVLGYGYHLDREKELSGLLLGSTDDSEENISRFNEMLNKFLENVPSSDKELFDAIYDLG